MIKSKTYLITNQVNQKYLTAFTGSTSVTLIHKKEKYIFVDGRYTEQVKKECQGCNIISINQGGQFFNQINEVIKQKKIADIIVEGQSLTIEKFQYYKKNIKAKLVIESDVVENLRISKSDVEIKKLQDVAKITDKIFNKLMTYQLEGLTEVAVLKILRNLCYDAGITDFSFDPIIASGPNGALPHASVTKRKIKKNELVTIDFGVVYNGYVSDITRTFAIGKANRQLEEIHQIVKKAMELAISSVKAGKKTAIIDKIARDYIISQGYGDYFVHATGHGIGIEVHELPYLNSSSKAILKAGMVVTVEPGIYLPNVGGVRIEQDVLVTKDGPVILNSNKNTDINVYNKTKKKGK